MKIFFVTCIVFFLTSCRSKNEQLNQNIQTHPNAINIASIQKTLNDNPKSSKNYYSFNSAAALFLGHGFSLFQIDRANQSPFNYDYDTLDGVTSLTTNFELLLALNKQQLIKDLDVDAKLSIRYLGFGGDASLKVVNNSSFDESSLKVIIKGESEFGRIGLKNLQLRPEAQKLLSSPNDFIKTYGLQYAIAERRGVSVYFIIDINNVSEATKSLIKTEMSGSGSFGAVSVKMEVGIKSEISNASKQNRINIQVISKGGTGLESFAGIVKNIKSDNFTFDDIKSELGDYFKTLNFKNAAPLGYFCADYNQLGLTDIPPIEDLDKREFALSKIDDIYNETEKKLGEYQSILSYIHPVSYLLTEDQRNAIKLNDIPKLLNYEDSLKFYHDIYVRLTKEAEAYFIPPFPELSILPQMDIKVTTNSSNSIPDLRDKSLSYQITGKYLVTMGLYFSSPYMNKDKYPSQIFPDPEGIADPPWQMNLDMPNPYGLVGLSIKQDTIEINAKQFVDNALNNFAFEFGYSDPIKEIRFNDGTHPYDLYFWTRNIFGTEKKFRIASIYREYFNTDPTKKYYTYFLYKTPKDLE